MAKDFVVKQLIVWFQKLSIRAPQRVIANSGGGGSKVPNFCQESMSLNWNFQRGGGLKPKKPSVGEYGYFLEQLIPSLFQF